MQVSDAMVEAACAAEQTDNNRYNWPEDWDLKLAADYRAGMRVFLSSVAPLIEAAALEMAAKIADERAHNATQECCANEAASIAASIRSRIEPAPSAVRKLATA